MFAAVETLRDETFPVAIFAVRMLAVRMLAETSFDCVTYDWSILSRAVVNSDETFKRLRLASVPTFRVVTLASGVERVPVLTVSAWSESTLAPSATLRPKVPVLVVCIPTLPSGSMTIAIC